MEIVTASQMRRIDRRAIDGLGIPAATLMANAGRGVADALVADNPLLGDRPVEVVSGKGNNGGDGFVCARRLREIGVKAGVVLMGRGAEIRGESAEHLAAARAAGVAVDEAADERAWRRLVPRISKAAVLVDALLGTGLRGGARGLVGTAIDDMVATGRAVASIDVPSGLDADSGAAEGPVVRARWTYTLCRPKLGLVLEPGATLAGDIRVVPIGIPPEAVAAEGSIYEWLDAQALRGLLPARSRASHKGDYGHVLIVAGSRGKSGAAVLAARGALRAGVGLVTVAAPRSAQPLIAVQQPEVMTEPLAETRSGALARAAARPLLGLMAGRDALALGPGLGTRAETRDAIRAVLHGRSVPTVLDADALNACAEDPKVRRALEAVRRPSVLTPHPGEAARLIGSDTRSVQADRLGAARGLAERTGAVVVLKGYRTVIADPAGVVSFNVSGNPGMATGGIGDVLTGVIAALLARGLDPRSAARLGVFAHGDAGDRAARRVGQEGLIAADLIQEISGALEALVGGEAVA